MNIKRTELKPTIYKVQAFCKICGTELIRSDNVLLSKTPKYEYKCLNCMTKQIDSDLYPNVIISYDEIDGSEVTTEYLNDR